MKEAKKLSYLLGLLEDGKFECSRCSKVKSKSEFYESQWSVTGLNSWCIDCCKNHFKLAITKSRAAKHFKIKTDQVTQDQFEQYKQIIFQKRLQKSLQI